VGELETGSAQCSPWQAFRLSGPRTSGGDPGVAAGATITRPWMGLRVDCRTTGPDRVGAHDWRAYEPGMARAHFAYESPGRLGQHAKQTRGGCSGAGPLPEKMSGKTMTLARRHAGHRALVIIAGTGASCAFGGARDTRDGRRAVDIMHLHKRTPGASGGLRRVTATQKKEPASANPAGFTLAGSLVAGSPA
jgi:hypothetical protein